MPVQTANRKLVSSVDKILTNGIMSVLASKAYVPCCKTYLYTLPRNAVIEPRNKLQVIAGVGAALILSALPFLSPKVREREQAVANMRDASLDAKDEARNSRLRTSNANNA